MRKISLFMLLALVAQVCVSATMESVGSYTFPNSDLSSSSTYTGTRSGTSLSLYCYKIGGYSSGKANSKQLSGTYYHKLTSNSAYVKMTLSSGSFQVGDQVKVTMYCGSSATDGFYFKSRSGNSKTVSLSSSSAVTLTYTLKSADINSDGTLTLYRYGSNCYVKKVWVKRAVSTSLPSAVLDLTNWKLNIPIAGDNGYSKEISQPELDTYSDDYFHVNTAGDAVVFKAHANGVTTSGSTYPRSELREMTDGGTKKASWNIGSGNGTHIMEITQAVTHLPTKKPHVVVGQIHDAGDDVIVFRLENKKLFIDHNGDDGPVLTSNYELGTKFTVKFVAGGGGVMCFYNGEYIETYPSTATGCYFKAGMYTQSKTTENGGKESASDAEAYGEAEIYSLTVSHSSSDPKSYSYYTGTSSNSAKEFSFSTGVSSVEVQSQEKDMAVYDLTGVKVGSDLSKLPNGVYIRGGVKVVKK